MMENMGIKKYYDRLSDDLRVAKTMQKSLLPPQLKIDAISKSHKLNIACQCESPDDLAGNFWGVDVFDADRLFFYMADFSGHGLSAALNTFRLHSIMSVYGHELRDNILSPAEYLEKLNRDLFALLPTEQYATMLCGIIDLKRDVFTFATAAPPAPVKMTVGLQDMIALDPSGVPLGMIEDAVYEVREIPFKKTEMLFFYSDVLIESQDKKGDMIGEDKFIDFCCEASMAARPPEKFLDYFMEKFDSHVARPLTGDLTAVTLIRR
ncbi:MAG: hypothetical protein COA93_01710 [Alphaproteobacteria bacterium]|nr:MAG: hypothetical protein COA93_01710 [Alphaproteobacteria bacterium]